MNTKEKAKRTGILFIALLIIGGLVLMYTGNDALVLATEKKEGILTAEQVKLSFDSVGGRLVKEAVKVTVPLTCFFNTSHTPLV